MSSLDAFNASPYLSIKHSSYFAVYDRLLAPYLGKPITFLEVGVFSGGSLFMWRELLGPEARIIGVDLNPAARRWEEHGFEIFIGSQADPAFWSSVFEQVGDIDVLLDDGGHTFEQQIATTVCVLPHVRDGGLVIVEDTHTSYLAEFGGPSPVSFVSFAKNIVDGVNMRYGDLAGQRSWESVIYSVRFFESIVALEVDRRLARPSTPCRNQGEAVDTTDYRLEDTVRIPAGDLLKCFRY